MPGEASREEMILIVLSVALALCFKAEESYLSEEQILVRKFTPTEEYSRACLRQLIENQAIEYEWVDSTNPIIGESGLLYFKNPVRKSQSHQAYNFEQFRKLLEFSEAAPGNQLYFLSLRIDVAAQECIEYARFYAKKSAINIINIEANNAKLKLMLMELEVEKVYALIWRSIKMKMNNGYAHNINVSFSELIDNCFDKFSSSRKNGLDLEKYKRPAQIKPSMISRIAEKALTVIPKINQYTDQLGSNKSHDS